MLDRPFVATQVTGAELDALAEAAESVLRPIMLEGRYDDLFERSEHGVVEPTPSVITQRCISALQEWVRRQPAIKIPHWPMPASAVVHLISFYRRQVLLREMRSQRPQLFSNNEWPFPPGPIILDRRIAEFASMPEVTVDDIELYANIILCAVWAAVDRYELFNTPHGVLVSISGILDDLARNVARAASLLRKPRRRSRSTPVDVSKPFVLGVRALIDLERGRIARAIGGDRLVDAEKYLTAALEYYEERAVTRVVHDERASHVDLIFSSYRAAIALLQLAYLNLLKSRCRRAEAHLKTARLLALTTRDAWLQSELTLVGWSVRRVQLMNQRPNGLHNGGRPAIESGLSASREFCVLHRRTAYECMALFQLAVCSLYDLPRNAELETSEGMRIADDIEAIHFGDAAAHEIELPNAEFSTHVYWRASTALLRARICVWHARTVSGRSKRRAYANQALGHIDEAGVIAHRYHELTNMVVDCQVYRAEALVYAGEPPLRALDELDAIDGTMPTSGYTTLPGVLGLATLVRVIALRALNDQSTAWRILSDFERTVLPKNEVGWLKDLYVSLRNEIDADNQFPVITIDDVRSEFLAQLEGATSQPVTTERRFTYRALEQRFIKQLCDATVQVFSDEPITAKTLARIWGVREARARRICKANGVPLVRGRPAKSTARKKRKQR